MNNKDIAEIRKRFSVKKNNLSGIRGCYVNSKGAIISRFSVPLDYLSEEEGEKYLSLFKKVLGGMPGRNLVNVEFPYEDVGNSDIHNLLMSLKDGTFDDELEIEQFFSHVIEAMHMEGNYLILLTQDVYDVPGYNRNGERDGEISDEVFRYIVCSICPVRQGKPGLVYSTQDNLFHTNDTSQLVGAPEIGFMFPAFEERSADICDVTCYFRDTKGTYQNFVNELFRAIPPMPAMEQKAAFCEILTETLEDDCSLEVVQSVHDQICEQISEQKKDKEAPVAKVSAPQIRQVLQECGVPEEKLTAFEERYQEEMGSSLDMSAINVMDTRSFEVKTPNVVIKVAPDHSDVVETRIIDGEKYILIRVDEGIEVNGVAVKIREN